KADIVEIGIPFSDPIAESPQIQNASKRAIENGATLVKIFDTIKDFRKNNGDIAIILSLYINTIFAFGADKFFSLCDECNISALAVPDLPFEEQDEILPICNAHGVYLLNQTTNASQERAKMIATKAKGILLCTFCKGTTPSQQQSFIAFLRENTNVAIACGNEFV
ncbi:MAG: tryptophan synthase subunit alpha, partial [Oscillospiraceae bacterium]